MKVWMLCEAFCLDCDDFGPRNAMTAWALPCRDRRAAMRELEARVWTRALENYECLDDADDVRRDVDEVMSTPERLGRGRWRYGYSAGDREVVWRVYPCEVMR